VNVTNAMAEIATRRLYRETHPTFAAFLRERWGISRTHGHRLALAGRVAQSPVGDRIANERQAREVAGLLGDPELLSLVVERAAEIRGDRPLTASALRQARAELTLPPTEHAAAREVYRAAEWAADAVARWQEWAARLAAGYVELLPPELWGWGHAQYQDEPMADDEALRRIQAKLAMDAPLTPEVVAYLRDAPGGPLADVFAHQVAALSGLSDSFRGMGDRFNQAVPESSDWPIQLAQALASILAIVSRRMADVLVAVAEPPALPRRTWTPAEVEAARADWTRRVDQAREAGTVGPWPPGPTLDVVRDVMGQLHRLTDRWRAELDDRRHLG
jgi:hypothetical protein